MIIPHYEVWGDSDNYKHASVTPYDQDYGSIEVKIFEHWLFEALAKEVSLLIPDLEQAKSFIAAIQAVIEHIENHQKESGD